MKFHTHNDAATTGPIVVTFTALQGFIQGTIEQIWAAFGPPKLHPNGERMTHEWHVQFGDGTVATIYNWLQQVEPKWVIDWRIGGHNSRSNTLVHEAFRAALHRDQDERRAA